MSLSMDSFFHNLTDENFVDLPTLLLMEIFLAKSSKNSSERREKIIAYGPVTAAVAPVGPLPSSSRCGKGSRTSCGSSRSVASWRGVSTWSGSDGARTSTRQRTCRVLSVSTRRSLANRTCTSSAFGSPCLSSPTVPSRGIDIFVCCLSHENRLFYRQDKFYERIRSGQKTCRKK